jgi:hypothetical protein
VPVAEWPLDLNGKPSHPWKWSAYLYLLDTATGEASTFWTNTTGGWIAVDDLTKQILAMRRMEPNAIPLVSLMSRDMPTRFGASKPRPHFQICGWKTRSGVGPQQPSLSAPEPQKDPGPPAATSSEAVFNDAVPF